MTDLLATYPPSVLAVIALIFLAGGIVKGALGFGLPLVTMSLLPLVMPVEAALAINALATPFNNLAQFVQARRIRETIVRFRWVLAGLTVGILAGAAFVSYVNDRILVMSLGVFVVLFTILTALSPKIVIPPQREGSIGLLTGLAGGVIGALTTANGPIFVMYLVGLRLERVLFVSTLGLFFIVTGVLLSGSFLAVGLLSVPILILAAICIPASHVGMMIGNWLASKVPAERFRNVVLAALGILGANLILQGVNL